MTERGAAARRKGHSFERAVANFLGVRTTRSVRPGIHDDAGDIVLDGWLCEIRSRARWSISLWFDVIEHKVLNGERPSLILHRPHRSLGDALVVMRLSDFRDLITEEPT